MCAPFGRSMAASCGAMACLMLLALGCGTHSENQSTTNPTTGEPAPHAPATATDPGSASSNAATSATPERAASSGEPTPPVTVKQAKETLDLTKLKHLDPVELSDFAVTIVDYTALATPKQAVQHYVDQLSKLGWVEGDESSGRYITDEYASTSFSKRDFWLSFSSHPSGEENTVNIRLINHGNFDSRRLPLVEGGESLFGARHTSIYATPESVPDTVNATRRLMRDAGWQEFGPMDGRKVETPDMAMLDFLQNGVVVGVYASVAPAQGGKTTVQYSTRMLTHDVPLPPDCDDLLLDEHRLQYTCTSSTEILALAEHFQNVLTAEGWFAMSEQPEIKPERATLGFRQKPDRHLRVDLKRDDSGKSHVSLETARFSQPLAADEPRAEPVADPLEMPQPEPSETDEPSAPTIHNPALVRTFDTHGSSIKSIVFSPDGHQLWAGGWSMHAWLVATGETLDIPNLSDVYALAFSLDGSQLAIAQREGMIEVWNATDGDLLAELAPEAGAIEGLAYSPDGQILASTSEDGRLLRWKTADWQPQPDIAAHDGFFTCLTYSPDGQQLATARFTTKLWNASNGQLLRELKTEPATAIGQLTYSPDSRILAAAGLLPTVKLWDVSTGQIVRTLQGHRESASCVAFSPDGKLIASGSWTKIVLLQDAQTGETLRTLRGHTESVSGVAFSPDGTLLATAGEEGRLRLWDVATLLADPESETDLHPAEPDDDAPMDEGPLEADFVSELPIPSDNSGYSSEGTPFLRTIHVTTNRTIETLLEFYRTQLAELQWQETPDAAQVSDTAAQTTFTLNGDPLSLSLMREFNETTISLVLRRPQAAREAGILAEPNRGRVIFANSSELPVQVSIAGQQVNLKVGEGEKEPNGPSVNVEPGPCQTEIRIGDQPAQTETFDIAPNQTWGLIILPEGALPVLMY